MGEPIVSRADAASTRQEEGLENEMKVVPHSKHNEQAEPSGEETNSNQLSEAAR